MRYLIAPDKFKGTLSAQDVGQVLAEVIHQNDRDATVDILPIADGGEGTAALLGSQLGAQTEVMETQDALGRPVIAEYFVSKTEAFFDMSAASGLWRIAPQERNPLQSNTFGTGLIIKRLTDLGLDTIYIGLGGSATVDAGIGMAAALGYKFIGVDGSLLEPVPDSFDEIVRIQEPVAHNLPKVVGLADVETTLLGESGAIYTFGPQKGLNPEQVRNLDIQLAHLVQSVEQNLSLNYAAVPRAGAAGGLGYGIMTFLKGKLISGFAVVADRLRLANRIAAADIVITGEGKLDLQSLQGKGPFGVASTAKAAGKPVWAIAGAVDAVEKMSPHFDRIISVVGPGVTLDEALARPAETLRASASQFWRK
ncbi:MAG: glycerate kinase [Verrucomicrobia bacterium]|nr:glycerate kinase [Verrucomicrobiota bacterium]